MEDNSVNGCGCGSGILKYFKPPYHEFFKIECNAHDLAYDDGGSEIDRLHADRWLFKRMAERVMACEYTPLKTTWMICISLLYYVSVRIFGGNYYNFKD
jgi:hypothetical protein